MVLQSHILNNSNWAQISCTWECQGPGKVSFTSFKAPAGLVLKTQVSDPVQGVSQGTAARRDIQREDGLGPDFLLKNRIGEASQKTFPWWLRKHGGRQSLEKVMDKTIDLGDEA